MNEETSSTNTQPPSQQHSPHYIGHRQRLRSKFSANPDSITDYELLEMLLFYVFQRCDTKPLAKSLLKHFGSLREIIFANTSDLRKIEGIGDSTVNFVILIHELINRVSFEKVKENKIITSTSDVLEYYKNRMENLKKEQFRVMFLNNKNKLITEELMQWGTVTSTAVYPREIIQKALEFGASAIIMVHNHPSGDPRPSQQDITMTRLMKDIAQKLDIVLLDHIIIGKTKTSSLKQLKII